MKKKNAFTLIELLAVIVVLAIIALIATPIVMNTIKKSKKGAAERSADSYIRQVETAVAEARLDNKTVPDGTYQIDEEGNLIGTGLPDGKLKIEMNGNKPTGGTITISNGQVTTASKMTVGSYEVAYNPTNKKYEATEKEKKPQVEVLCTANKTKVSALVWSGNADPTEESSYASQEVGLLASDSGAYTPGVSYTCELGDNDAKTFFVLETNGDNVSLIMDKNIDSNGKGTTSGNTVVWISDEDWAAAGGVVTDAMKNDGGPCQYGEICLTNEYGPITANKILKERTSGWTKLTESQISLPSYDQIYKAAGNKTSGLPTWLYVNLNIISEPYAYWTSTPSASDSVSAWSVDYDGNLNNNIVVDGGTTGVRPVITVSKSNLS